MEFLKNKVQSIRSINDQIAHDLKQQIFFGELELGTKLPSESQLCEIYSVGRNTVREALKNLAAEGLLESRVGKNGGHYISNIPEESFYTFNSNENEISLKLHQTSLVEIIEMRNIIEIQIAALAAERRTELDLVNIKKQIQKLEKEDLSNLNFFLYDLIFHKSLALASKNQFLVISLLSVIKAISSYLINYKLEPNLREILLNDLWEIYYAVENKDSQQAQKLMSKHLNREYPLSIN